MPDVTDLTFRTDRNKNPIYSKRGEYVCNIAKMLFNLIPGTDEYTPKRGLNIRAKMEEPGINNTRDAPYEHEIVEQFQTYTDLIPMNVIVQFRDHKIYVYLQVQYMDDIYEMDLVGTKESLDVLLRTQ